ncbi:5'-hydroxyaverantin dehydrogenase [Madurella mycetomatis]|uniref:5'-hydroxyaverantin dehydrogenase n=1 Tax=Madurella mycetomatis TaxID=100816 RepID=A0A175VZR8_9PEZI|nr:5'-hydroxyaverantin dehydrogenase [Madurella mycetomatis]
MTALSPADDLSWSVVDTVGQSAPVDCTKPYDTSTLAGKTIIITGGASGFGAAFARHWARHGSHIIIGDVNDRAGEELVAELRSLPLSRNQYISYQHCDVTSWTDQLSLFQIALSSSPTRSIDAVVAGAGIADNTSQFDHPSPCPEHTTNTTDGDHAVPPPAPPPLRVLDVNLTGVMYTAHLALYYLPLQGAGAGDRHLLLISSVAGLMPLPGQTEYTASKHAVMGLFRALRATSHLAGGVRVNALCPYFVHTPIMSTSGLALLAGGAKAELADVVDAATRLMADEGIVGRALMIGPGMEVVDDGEDGLGSGFRLAKDGERGMRRAVWEVHGHDFERVEVFVWRYLAMLNLLRVMRGWVGVVKDLWGLFIVGMGR